MEPDDKEFYIIVACVVVGSLALGLLLYFSCKCF
jgi:hypothetical protein